MLAALLLPDPCDPHCPAEFKQAARRIMLEFPGGPQRWRTELKSDNGLHHAILHEFIADFANWDNAARSQPWFPPRCACLRGQTRYREEQHRHE